VDGKRTFVQTYKCNNSCPYLSGRGVFTIPELAKFLKETTDEVVFLNESAIRCGLKALIENDDGLTLKQLKAVIKSGGVVERSKELLC